MLLQLGSSRGTPRSLNLYDLSPSDARHTLLRTLCVDKHCGETRDRARVSRLPWLLPPWMEVRRQERYRVKGDLCKHCGFKFALLSLATDTMDFFLRNMLSVHCVRSNWRGW